MVKKKKLVKKVTKKKPLIKRVIKKPLHILVEKFIEGNSSEYYIITYGVSICIIGKLKEFTIMEVINPNGFNPLDKEIKVKEVVICMVYFDDRKKFWDELEESEPYDGLKALGCNEVLIKNEHEIERVMKSI